MRTDQQNKAIHKYCEMLAEDLNDAGWTVSGLLETVDRMGEVPWNQDTVKELIWRRFQTAMVGKSSTTKLEKPEVDEVYRVVSMNMAKIANVSTPFPDRFGDE